MKVVSPATTSVLRFVPRSENLKQVRNVSISLSLSALQHAAKGGFQHISEGCGS